MKKYFLLILIFLTSVTSGQSIDYGIKAFAFALKTEKLETATSYENGYKFFPPRAVYLFLKGTLNKNEMIEAALNLGYLDANDYSGMELGIFLSKYISQEIYLQFGFNMHFNGEKTNGINILDKSHSKVINFISAGAGYDFTNRISAELVFDYALKNEYGFSTPLEPEYSGKPKNIFHIIKFGLGYKIFP